MWKKLVLVAAVLAMTVPALAVHAASPIGGGAKVAKEQHPGRPLTKFDKATPKFGNIGTSNNKPEAVGIGGTGGRGPMTTQHGA